MVEWIRVHLGLLDLLANCDRFTGKGIPATNGRGFMKSYAMRGAFSAVTSPWVSFPAANSKIWSVMLRPWRRTPLLIAPAMWGSNTQFGKVRKG
jgi:hypothetical protein